MFQVRVKKHKGGERMKCIDCDDEMDDKHIWAGYCPPCFVKLQDLLQDWVKENLTINRDAAGVVIAVAGKTAAIIDSKNESFQMLTYLRWFLANYRSVWENSKIHITYNGDDFDIDKVVIGTENTEGDEPEWDTDEYQGMAYG